MAESKMILPMSVPDNPALRFLLTGAFTDFQIRTRGYCFNVHRAIVAGQSHYFENVCGGVFKVNTIIQCGPRRLKLTFNQEAKDCCVNVDETPIFMATLILGLYQGSYGYDDYLTVKGIMENAYTNDGNFPQVSHDLRDNLPHKIHAAMFALSEYYEAPTLLASSAQAFYRTIDSKDAPITLNTLVDAIHLVYKVHTTINDTLRAKATYTAQGLLHDLTKMRNFEKLFNTTPTFAWDLATRYKRASWLYCQICREETLLKDCSCGLTSLCGQRNCVYRDAASWTCKSCDTTGQLVQDNSVRKHAGDKGVGEKTVSDCCGSMGEATVKKNHVKKSPVKNRRDS